MRKGQLKSTKEEQDFLRENYNSMGVAKIARILGKSIDSVDDLRRKLGIPATRKKDREWTKEENDFLINNYGKLSFEEISKAINKPIGGIDARRRRLGIKAIGTGERMRKLHAEGNHPMQRKEVVKNFLGDKNPSCRQEVKDKISEIRKREYALGINKCGWKGNSQEPTKAEYALMGFLISKGFSYNYHICAKMHVNYHLDFAHIETKLCVEVDGSSHRNQKERDNRKDTFLKSKGWFVMRITNEEVLNNFEDVKSKIMEKLSELKKKPHII